MKVKIFTAAEWVQLGQLEHQINAFVANKHVNNTRTETATAMLGNNQPVVVVTVWYD